MIKKEHLALAALFLLPGGTILVAAVIVNKLLKKKKVDNKASN